MQLNISNIFFLIISNFIHNPSESTNSKLTRIRLHAKIDALVKHPRTIQIILKCDNVLSPRLDEVGW